MSFDRYAKPIVPMRVKDLIALLQKHDQDLPVCYRLHSEQCLLESDDISVEDFQPPRNDGWVHDKRPDKPTQTYLVLLGN